MSNYPPTQPYGGGYEARDNTNPPFLPPTYPNQYQQPNDGRTVHGQVQAHAVSNYDAYGYNRVMPRFSAAAVASGVPPLPIYQGWHQDSIPLPQYTAPSNTSQYTGFSNNSQHNAQYYPPVSQTAYQPSMPAPKPFDQRELSEGEFEDGATTTNTPPAGHGAAQYQGSGTGYMDNAHHAVYSRTQDHSPQQPSYPANNYNHSAQDLSQSNRQQSASYSPYVSPIGDNGDQSRANQYQDTYAPSHTSGPTNGVAQPQYGWSQNSQGNNSQQGTNANGYSTPKGVETTNQVQASQATTLDQVSNAPNGKSVAEEKKKAQGAILNLWPYDVRYQTYINEGFKPDIIGRLFDDLRMPRTSSKSINGTQVIGDAQKLLGTSTRASLTQENLSPVTDNSSSGHQLTVDSRKDAPLGLMTKQPVTNGSVAATTTSLSDKERTLQAKMEALRKSREERAQKAAAQKDGKLPATVDPVLQPPKAKPTELIKESSSTSESPISTSQPQLPTQVVPSSSDAAPTSTQPPPPIIPGLFLASTASSPAPSINQQSAMYAPPQINPRKRPVAADFDEPLLSMTVIKRPFGHSRTDQPLVIDVSEDEAESDDEDVAMDLASDSVQDSPTQSARSFDNRAAAIQNLPALSNFPSRKQTSPESSAANTPPVPQAASRSSLGKPEVLQRKESEIELLKKKIAEAEARKKARQTPTGIRTPRSAETTNVEKSNTTVATTNVTSNVEASIAMQHLIGLADSQVDADQQRLAEAEAAELAKVEELKRNEAERIRLRLQEIETELPRVESEYQQNQRKLEEMRAEMARIEANVQKNLEQKQRYNEEMARLGQETENQLQAQKEKLRDLTKNEVESDAAPSLPSSTTMAGEDTDKFTEPIPNGQIPMRPLSAQPSPSRQSADKQTRAVGQFLSPEQVDLSAVSIGTSNDSPVDESQLAKLDVIIKTTQESASADHALEAALQDAVRAEADAHILENGDLDMETLYAPDPSQLAPDSAAVEEKRSLSYSPLLRRSSFVEERESDGYEPPEATPPSDSPPFSPAPPNEDNFPTVDDSMQDISLGSAIKSISDSTSREPINEDGDLTVEPPQNGSAPQLVEMSKKTSSNPLYTPYESPLKIFRSYRFHPEFKQQIPGGLRSLTYSHKIDPKAEFCRYELAGGICNDNTCDLLHFKDIGLPDDAILTALGSPEEFKGPRRDEFCAGLKQVLIDLRVRKIRDFQVIASEILAFRTKFLGDASKVLPLEGTSI